MENQNQNSFSFDNPYIKSRWAKGKEFEGRGKQIKILNFEILLKGEGNPPAYYVSEQWNGTYRLTFSDFSEQSTRIYENRYQEFCDDLKKAQIKPNQLGILKRYRDEKNHWRWSWQFIENQL